MPKPPRTTIRCDRAPRHAHARGEVVAIRMDQRAIEEAAVLGGEGLSGRRVDVGQQVVAIDQRREDLVADAGCHRQVGSNAPAVLRVELPAVRVEVGLVEQRQPLRARQAEQEVAKAETGVAAVEEIQLAVERSQVDVVKQIAAELRRRTSASGCRAAR